MRAREPGGSNRASKALAIVLSVIAVVLAAVAAGILLGGPGELQEDQSVEEPASAPSTKDLNLSDDGDRVLMNRCMSWMSQAFLVERGSVDLSSAYEQVHFAAHYIALVDPGARERGDYAGVPGFEANAGGGANARIAVSRIDEVVQEFFGTTPDYDALARVYRRDGDYVYFKTTAPEGQTAAYSAVTDVEPIGDGRYAVSFEAFNNGMPYEEKNDAFYANDPSGMMNALGAKTPAFEGTAVVRMVEDDGRRALVVEEYRIASEAAESDSPVDEPTVITTPYYTITIPAGWAKERGGFTYEVNEALRYDSSNTAYGMGCMTTLDIGGGSIRIACFTDTWGPQGDFDVRVLGTPANLPGWHICVLTASSHAAANSRFPDLTGLLDDVASFVEPTGVFGGQQGWTSSAVPDTASTKADFSARFESIVPLPII